METNGERALDKWKEATMDMEILQLKLKRKLKEKQEIFEKINPCSQSKQKTLELEKDIELVQSEMKYASTYENSTQIGLSQSGFLESSIRMIHANANEAMAIFSWQFERIRREIEETLKELKITKDEHNKMMLHEKSSKLREEIESLEIEKRITSKILGLSNVLKSDNSYGSIGRQWKDAVDDLENKKAELSTYQNQEHKSKMETLTKEIEKVSTNVGTFQSVLSRLQCKSNRLTGTELTIESDNEEQPRETVKGSEGYQENKPAIPQTKSIKEEEEDVQDCQNQEKHLDSASNHTDRERFEKRYGMIIESKNPKDFSYKAVPWTSDERIDIISGSVFPDGFKLDTDIFYIKESTAGNPIDRENVSKRGVLFKVPLSMENCSYYEYKGAVKYENEWEFINYSVQDRYLVFEVSQVESFCMISSINRHRHTIVPAGSQFISDIDHRIQVKFPPNAVSRDKQIAFKIHPVDLDYILERTTEPTNDEVYAITSGLSTTHMEFKMMFKVQLPLFTISDLCHEPEYINYNILKWTDDGLFQITDIQPVISNGLVSFETNSFSGYCCVGTKRPQISSSLESFVPEIYGLRKLCKILFFVGKISNNSIPIMLECVELQRVSEVCEKRQKYGYHFVSEWISRDLFFTPNSTIITVEVKGRFKIPKESSVRLPRLSFIPVARDNFSHFLVELRGSGVAYGILSLREERKVLYEIYYYPDTKKQPTVPLKKVWNPIIKGSSTKMTETKEIKGKTVNITTNFFSEKGLLTLSEKMNPDTMFKFCLHMNMTSAQYHTIRQIDGYTAMGNLKVIQTALDQQPQKGNLNLVIEALTQAGQKDLAEKVAELYSNKMPLHTI